MQFSIVTVCWNSDATIEDTLRSVYNQEFKDYEHILIDGGSTDQTIDIAKRFERDNLFIVSESDDGMYDAMNKGLRQSSGEYILFLNSDDFLARNDALTLIDHAAERSDADCIFAATRMISARGRTFVTRRNYRVDNFRSWWLRIGVMPPHPSAFVRREKLLAAGGFDTSFRVSSDFDLIAKVILRDGASWVVEPSTITNFRVGGVSTSGLKANIRVSRDITRSLKTLGQPLPWLSTQLRYIWKIAQFV